MDELLEDISRILGCAADRTAVSRELMALHIKQTALAEIGLDIKDDIDSILRGLAA